MKTNIWYFGSQALILTHCIFGLRYYMKIVVLFTFIAVFIQGCGSITQPTASRPIVESNKATAVQLSNDSLTEHLSNAKVGYAIIIQGQNLTLGEQFFAASGLSCRKVANDKNTSYIVYCQDEQKRWFKVNSVISQYTAPTSQDNPL